MNFRDETWMYRNMACNKGWKEILGDAIGGGLIDPYEKRKHSTLYHVECADTVLLDQCMLFVSWSESNKSADFTQK